MSGWSSHITAQKCTVQLRHLVRMRFLYQPIIRPRMVGMGSLSPRLELPVLCGLTKAANAMTVAFRSARPAVAPYRFGENSDVSTRPRPAPGKPEGGVLFALRRYPNSVRSLHQSVLLHFHESSNPTLTRLAQLLPRGRPHPEACFCKANVTGRNDAIDRIVGLYKGTHNACIGYCRSEHGGGAA